MIYRFVKQIFPMVSKELKGWQSRAEKIPDPELREQALASIATKKFHVQGGSVYALYPGVNAAKIVRFIVALQTISDYLDNLCDRAGVMDEAAFFQLHLAMSDAVDPERPIADYYQLYPFKVDGGYLESLVKTCREQITEQPAYHLVKQVIIKYVKWYSELQSYKHLALEIRETKLQEWAAHNLDSESNIYWWEFAAATGSTLGMFLLFVLAGDPTLRDETVEQVDRAYFPWVSGLHILLDYYIDADEDREMGDFNFTFKYHDLEECEQRLEFFVGQAINYSENLSKPLFHLTVIRGLLAMYLSDPKAVVPQHKKTSLKLVRYGGLKCSLYHQCCLLLRKAAIL